MKQERVLLMALGVGLILCIVWFIGSTFDRKPTVMQQNSFSTNSGSSAAASGSPMTAHSNTTIVPWDYKVEEAKVGDLLGEDMVLLPNNELIFNDQNYATGDQVWVLSYMNAEMSTDATGRNDVTLSAWRPIKTFKTAEEAKDDMAQLKLEIKTEIDIIGVYKTEYQGKFRHFAIVQLPSGHTIKQPIQEDRYNSLKDKKQTQAVLEEVHDYQSYDSAMAKFRGWAE